MSKYHYINQREREYLMRSMAEQVADEILVEQATRAMLEKLKKKRCEGRGGWHTDSCSNNKLMESLKDHIEKGDMVDVMNLAAMIYVRSLMYGDKA